MKTNYSTELEKLKIQKKLSAQYTMFSGKVSTPHGWVDVEKVVFAPPNPTNKQAKNWAVKQQQVGSCLIISQLSQLTDRRIL